MHHHRHCSERTATLRPVQLLCGGVTAATTAGSCRAGCGREDYLYPGRPATPLPPVTRSRLVAVLRSCSCSSKIVRRQTPGTPQDIQTDAVAGARAHVDTTALARAQLTLGNMNRRPPCSVADDHTDAGTATWVRDPAASNAAPQASRGHRPARFAPPPLMRAPRAAAELTTAVP